MKAQPEKRDRDPADLTQAAKTLKAGRQDLQAAFRQFEADSTAFAEFLRKGNGEEGLGSGGFEVEAKEIMGAVGTAERAVSISCGRVPSEFLSPAEYRWICSCIA